MLIFSVLGKGKVKDMPTISLCVSTAGVSCASVFFFIYLFDHGKCSPF